MEIIPFDYLEYCKKQKQKYADVIYKTREEYANEYNEKHKNTICCICYEPTNKYYTAKCDFCNEGLLCEQCDMAYEDTIYETLKKCPVCKNIMIQDSIRSICINALIDLCDYPSTNNTTLKRLWVNNFRYADDEHLWFDDNFDYILHDYVNKNTELTCKVSYT